MISKRIKELRESKGISQKKLAEIFNMSQQAIAKWETAKAEPDIEMLKNLSNYFNVDINYLIGNSDDPRPPNKEKNPLTPEDGFKILAQGRNLSKKDIEYLRETIKLLEFKNKVNEVDAEFGKGLIPKFN